MPKQHCTSCGRERRCELHSRAEFPPDAAKRWLLDHCPGDGKLCEIEYRADFLPGGPVIGM